MTTFFRHRSLIRDTAMNVWQWSGQESYMAFFQFFSFEVQTWYDQNLRSKLMSIFFRHRSLIQDMCAKWRQTAWASTWPAAWEPFLRPQERRRWNHTPQEGRQPATATSANFIKVQSIFDWDYACKGVVRAGTGTDRFRGKIAWLASGKTNSEYKQQEKIVCIDHTIQFVQNYVDLNAVELI